MLAALLFCCAACSGSPFAQKEDQMADTGTVPAEGPYEDIIEDQAVPMAEGPDAGEQDIPADAAEEQIAPADDTGAEEWADDAAAAYDGAENGYLEVTAKTDETIEEPIGYLKDKVTETGVLGEDYPILSYYGSRSSMNGQISSYHRGMDFDMPTGTALVTPGNCLIKYTGYNDTRGYWIVMYWGNGYYIVYQHLSQILVWEGLRLSKGNKVGYSGDTGASLTPHLHLEILQCDTGGDDITDFNDDSIRINPYYFIFGNEDAYSKPDWFTIP